VVKPEQFDAKATDCPQPSPPRAGLKPINTFNLNQTERNLTHRLIFWGSVGPSGTAKQGEDVA
jgi:hypothetical protein